MFFSEYQQRVKRTCLWCKTGPMCLPQFVLFLIENCVTTVIGGWWVPGTSAVAGRRREARVVRLSRSILTSHILTTSCPLLHRRITWNKCCKLVSRKLHHNKIITHFSVWQQLLCLSGTAAHCAKLYLNFSLQSCFNVQCVSAPAWVPPSWSLVPILCIAQPPCLKCNLWILANVELSNIWWNEDFYIDSTNK